MHFSLNDMSYLCTLIIISKIDLIPSFILERIYRIYVQYNTYLIWIWKNVQIADVFRSIGSALIGLPFSRLSSHWSFVFQALLSLVYLTSSDIFALINYTGFATWVSSTNRLGGLGALISHNCSAHTVVVLTRFWCTEEWGARLFWVRYRILEIFYVLLFVNTNSVFCVGSE